LTRIWLEELPAQLPNKATRLDAFDISAAQFPPEEQRVGQYMLHDILKPFPEEFHDVYDLVHVRYMVVALKKAEFLIASKNLFQIISMCTPKL
jgi:hypothetical protein